MPKAPDRTDAWIDELYGAGAGMTKRSFLRFALIAVPFLIILLVLAK